jgi:hypothetical protein
MRMLSVALLTALYFTGFSQNNFAPGFIVKNNGDSVKGYIEQGNEAKIFEKVNFKSDLTQNATQYLTATDISSFGFFGGNTFKKIAYTDPTENKQYVTFAKYLLKGYNSLYTFSRDDRTYFLIKNQQDSTYLLYDDIYTSTGSYTQTGNFRNVLLFVASGCGNLRNQITQLSYTEGEMLGLVAKINNCVAPSVANEVLYKKPKTELHVYGYAGGMYLGSNHEFTGRLIAKFTLPSVDKKTSLNVGVNFMQNYKTQYVYIAYEGNYLGTKTKQTVTNNIVSIPFTLQYYFTTGKVRAYFDAGFCYIFRNESGVLDEFRNPTTTNDNGPTYVIGAGIDYFVSNNLFIKADWRQEYMLHYPTIGISYFFK